jgi:hypothetical protein
LGIGDARGIWEVNTDGIAQQVVSAALALPQTITARRQTAFFFPVCPVPKGRQIDGRVLRDAVAGSAAWAGDDFVALDDSHSKFAQLNWENLQESAKK